MPPFPSLKRLLYLPTPPVINNSVAGYRRDRLRHVNPLDYVCSHVSGTMMSHVHTHMQDNGELIGWFCRTL